MWGTHEYLQPHYIGKYIYVILQPYYMDKCTLDSTMRITCSGFADEQRSSQNPNKKLDLTCAALGFCIVTWNCKNVPRKGTHFMHGLFPRRKIRCPAHSMPSNALQRTRVWLTSLYAWPPNCCKERKWQNKWKIYRLTCLGLTLGLPLQI